MDYWEFAQFIVMIGSPRLQNFKVLVRNNCSSQNVVMADGSTVTLQRFIETMRCQSKLAFFKDGSLPSKSQQVPDELMKCLHPQRSFEELVHTLPTELRQVVEEARCKGQLEESIMAFRAFEVYTLSCIAEKVSTTLGLFDNCH